MITTVLKNIFLNLHVHFLVIVFPYFFIYLPITKAVVFSTLALKVVGFLQKETNDHTLLKKILELIQQVTNTIAPPILGFIIFRQTGRFQLIEFGDNLLVTLFCLKYLEFKFQKTSTFIYVILSVLVAATNLLLAEKTYNNLYLLFVVASVVTFILKVNIIGDFSDLKFSKKIFAKAIGSASLIVAILFIFFPRFEYGQTFSFNPNISSTGFSDEIRPGSVRELVLRDEEFFIAKGEGIEGPATYWYGAYLHRNNGLEWKKGRTLQNQVDSVQVIGQYTVEMRRKHNGNLFFLGTASNVNFLGANLRTRERNDHIQVFNYRNREINYAADRVRPNFKKLNDQQREILLQYTDINDSRIDKLVNDLKLNSLTNQETIEKLNKWFRSSGFSYTLNPGNYGNLQLPEFLFERKQGFCEHYASTYAYLLRRMGIPSRVIVGFLGGTYNPYGNYVTISTRDAHAWVQYWDEGTWKQIDPTSFIAPDRITRGSLFVFQREGEFNEYLPDFLKNILLRVESWFYETEAFFVGFNLDAQLVLLKKIFGREINTRYLWIFSLVLSLLVTFGFYGLLRIFSKRKQLFSRLFLYKDSTAELRKEFQLFSQKLTPYIGVKNKHIGPKEYIYQVRGKIRNDVEALRILDNYLRLRFSDNVSDIDKKNLKLKMRKFEVKL